MVFLLTLSLLLPGSKVVADTQVVNRIGGHNSIGSTSPSETWYLAEGSTGGTFETWVLVQNPGQDTANIQLTYMTDSGERPGPTDQIPAGNRRTYRVNDTVPDEFNVSTRVTSDKDVIAERSMYWEMSIQQRIGQMFMIGIDGTTLTPEAEDLIRTVRPGGVILFGSNIQDAGQLTQLTADLQDFSLRETGLPLFISTDQEGGTICRVRWLDDAVPEANITSTEQAYQTGFNRAQALKALGINQNLAPVLDIGVEGDFLTKYGRCFQGTPQEIGELGESVISGQKDGGIMSTAKHFPGYGGISFYS